MSSKHSSLNGKNAKGWGGIGLIALVYTILFVLNYWLPLRNSNYATRLWNWSQAAITIAALVIVVRNRRWIKSGAVFLGFVLGIISAFSHAMHDPSFIASTFEGFGVWVCFLGGLALFKNLEAPVVSAFQLPLSKISISLLIGIAAAVPLAVVNNLYFYLNAGHVQLQNIFFSAFAALSPGIHEEIIFRYFVLAMCFSLFKPGKPSRLGIVASIFLAVVPHSLNHLPDLFLQSPWMGVFMLTATSLLFGLPMALLQLKRNLETAITFHWFVDFMRFLFGF